MVQQQQQWQVATYHTCAQQVPGSAPQMTVKRGSDQCVCVCVGGGLDPALEMPCKAAFWPRGGG